MAPVKLKYIVSFSSQDENHRANNLISGDGIKKWLCHPKDRSGKIEIIIQLEQATQFTYIDIGTLWCANLEIRVGQSDWPQNADYKTLVPMVTLMSPIDCQLGRKPTDTQMFSEKDFSDSALRRKWDRVQIICRQPYRKDMQSGISFLRIRNSAQGTVGSADSLKKNEVGQKGNPQQNNKISEIKKHFFGESKENNRNDVDSLKHRLLQISSSSDNGCDNLHQEALSRTAKLVLKASEKTHKSNSNAHYNLLSKQCQRGLFSDSLNNKTGITIEEEMLVFFPTLELSIVDVDSVTIADLRHKFECKKKRKLSIDEKRKFSSHCQAFIWNLSETDCTKNSDPITLGKPTPLSTPAARLLLKSSHSDSLKNKTKTSQNDVHKEVLPNSTFSPTSSLRNTSDLNKKRQLTPKVSPAAILRKKNLFQNEKNDMKCDAEDSERNKTNRKKRKKNSLDEEVDDDSCDSIGFGSDICYNNSDDEDSIRSLDIDDSSPTRKPQIKRRLQTLEDVSKSYQDLYKTFSPSETKEHHSRSETPVVKRKKLNSSSKKLIELFDTELSDNEEVQSSTPSSSNTWLCAKKANTNNTTPAVQSKRPPSKSPVNQNGILSSITSRLSDTMAAEKSGGRSSLSKSSSKIRTPQNCVSVQRGNSIGVKRNSYIGSSSAPQDGSSASNSASPRVSTCIYCGFLVPQETYDAHCTACARFMLNSAKAKISRQSNTSQSHPSFVGGREPAIIDLTAGLSEKESAEFTLCPICLKEFPQEIIMVHASECGL